MVKAFRVDHKSVHVQFISTHKSNGWRHPDTENRTADTSFCTRRTKERANNWQDIVAGWFNLPVAVDGEVSMVTDAVIQLRVLEIFPPICLRCDYLFVGRIVVFNYPIFSSCDNFCSLVPKDSREREGLYCRKWNTTQVFQVTREASLWYTTLYMHLIYIYIFLPPAVTAKVSHSQAWSFLLSSHLRFHRCSANKTQLSSFFFAENRCWRLQLKVTIPCPAMNKDCHYN